MADKAELKVASKEDVAKSLADNIARATSLNGNDPDFRNKYLDLYAECLHATSNQRRFE